ncbi:MAG: ATP-binding protein [Bacteroidales bacterium]|nr:ATP-binding protein [Bacteroidales bacterium]
MSNIIGRKQQIEELTTLFHKKQSQFVAVYGRRRVGKTFLVRELFKEHFAFYHTGVSPLELEDTKLLETQLEAFHSTLIRYGAAHSSRPKNWMEAFDRLTNLLENHDKEKRMVVFIDEMPWMDTPRSGFVTAFEHFWNGWGAGQDNLMLIVCGSATSWIQDNLINSYGGLYERVNAEIQLSPFTLHEAEELLKSQDVTLTRYDILQLYMAVGGIPMYLSYVQPGLSLAQIIDSLYFDHKAKLKDEFERVFNSLFRSPEPYKSIIRLLAMRQSGYSRDEISEKTGIVTGKSLSQTLHALEASDFIERYKPFENNKRNFQYRLVDPFCLFYLDQVEGRARSEHFWRDNENYPALNTWRGRAFENACLSHVEQVKTALGVSGVSSENAAWTMRGMDGQKGMQIDLIISRSDRVINLCEMKFVNTDFEVKSDYEKKLRERLQWMIDHVSRTHNVQMTLVTTYGLKYGIHSGIFQKTVTLDSLFEPK